VSSNLLAFSILSISNILLSVFTVHILYLAKLVIFLQKTKQAKKFITNYNKYFKNMNYVDLLNSIRQLSGNSDQNTINLPNIWLYRKGGQIKKGESGIHIKPENKGKFTAKANRAGKGVQEYARHVLANKEDFPSSTVKQANFARNASK